MSPAVRAPLAGVPRARVPRTRGLLLVLASAAWSACMNASDVDLLEVPGTGAIAGQAFLDLNGSGTLDGPDSVLANVRVLLTPQGAMDPIADVTTGEDGTFALLDVPVGTYTVAIDPELAGDSLVVLGAAGSLEVGLGEAIPVALGLSYPALALEDVRAAAPGRRVFTTGIALNTRQPFGDGQVHLQGATAWLRATNVERAGIDAGDSVRFLGRIAVDNGQPVLDSVLPFVLVNQAQMPAAVPVSIAEAASAGGGALDAALVRIQDAEITDTATVDGDFRFLAYTGTDTVEVVLRSFLGIGTGQVRPDTVVSLVRATGLLRPHDDGTGTVRWRLLPRAGADLALAEKRADVAVSVTVEPAAAATGDTVEITVTAQNGPSPQASHTATGVRISVPLPTGLAFVDATATGGAYDEASGVWSAGDLAPGAPAVTLMLRAKVTAGPGTVSTLATLQALEREVEANGANNIDAAVLTVS
ncbi:MAG TPA: DUF11 domain-containing protein [Longimicrobiales bacterium]|nr:DUF11 domain-containing protein [Longimicrobiales bacterium]